jgi:hypothetical protein
VPAAKRGYRDPVGFAAFSDGTAHGKSNILVDFGRPTRFWKRAQDCRLGKVGPRLLSESSHRAEPLIVEILAVTRSVCSEANPRQAKKPWLNFAARFG